MEIHRSAKNLQIEQTFRVEKLLKLVPALSSFYNHAYKCLDTSVGRGVGSYPTCRRFESCSRHQCLQMDVLSSPWPRCLIPGRKHPQCSCMRETLLGVTGGSGSVS